MVKNISEENIQKLVKATLESPFSMIKMLKKHGHKAAYRIDHGQLHLDFDDRENNSWNMDIISLFPTDHPVAMTSWKGIIYVHYLEEPPVNCSCMGSREILEKIIAKVGDENKIKEILKGLK